MDKRNTRSLNAPGIFLFAPTSDPSVFIEEQREGYIRYRSLDGRRWGIEGTCDHRGDCLVGAVIDGEYVDSIERAHELALAYTGLDSPVTPEFSGCCPLKGKWL